MAECPSCGRSYQAPDSMAGKRVRCKQCQTVFQIAAPPTADEGGGLDIEGLERSFAGGQFDEGDATATATAMGGTAVGGPSIDADGRVSIRRAGDVSAMGLRGDGTGSGPLRTNLRFRYPFARQVDVGLPWLLVLLGLGVPLWLSLTRGANFYEHPTPGIGTSRYVVMLLAFLAIVFPLTHVAVTKAARDLRFNLPRTPLWRSLACAFATMLLTGTLFILSGGTIGGLILGILVGVGATVALSLLLFRTLPHEMPGVAAHVAVGAGVGAIVASALIGGVNFAAASIARAGSNPTLFVSPIVVGGQWVDKPVDVVERPTPKPPVAVATKPAPATAEKPPEPAGPRLVALSIPQVVRDPGEQKFVRSIEQTPIAGGFADFTLPLVPSPALGIIRNAENGLIECWDTSSWTLPPGHVARNFRRDQPLFVNTTGDRVVRMVSTPYLRIEPLPLDAGAKTSYVTFENPNLGRQLEGFRGPAQLVVRVRSAHGLAFEVYDLENGGKRLDPKYAQSPDEPGFSPKTATPMPLSIEEDGKPVEMGIRNDPESTKFMADGGVVVAGLNRAPKATSPTCLALFDLAEPGRARRVVDVRWGDPGTFAPLAMAVNDAGHVGLLLDANGEAYFTAWRLRDEAGAEGPQIVERTIGLTSTLRPGRWNERTDAMIWLDARTLLLWGRTLVDAQTGNTIGTVTIPNVVGQVRLGEGDVLFLTEDGGGSGWLRVRYDLDAISGKPNG